MQSLAWLDIIVVVVFFVVVFAIAGYYSKKAGKDTGGSQLPVGCVQPTEN